MHSERRPIELTASDKTGTTEQLADGSTNLTHFHPAERILFGSSLAASFLALCLWSKCSADPRAAHLATAQTPCNIYAFVVEDDLRCIDKGDFRGFRHFIIFKLF